MVRSLLGTSLVNQPVGINKRIADRLLDDGVIDESDFMRSVEFAKRKQKRIEEVMLELDVIDETKLLKYIATLHKTQFVSTGRLQKAKVDREAIKVVSYKLAKHYGVYPLVLDRKNDKLVVATADPDNTEAIQELRMATGVSRVMAMVARPAAVLAAIARGYEGDQNLFQKLAASQASELAAGMMLGDPFRSATDRQLGEPERSDLPPQLPTRPGQRRRTGQPHTGEYAPAVPDHDYRRDRPSRPRRATGDPRYHQEGQGGYSTELDEPGYQDEEPFYDPEPTPDFGGYGAPPPPRRRRHDEAGDDYGTDRRHGAGPSRSDTDTGYGNPRGGYARGDHHRPPPRPPPHRRRHEGERPPDRDISRPPAPRYDPGYDERAEPEPPSDPTPPGYSAPPPPDQAQALADPRRSDPKRTRSIIPPMRRASYAALGLGPLSTRATLEEEAPPSRAILSSSAYLESLRVLVGLLENDRRDLRGHSAAVARLALDVGERIALSTEHRDALVLAAYLHDLGKMGSHHLTALNIARDEQHRTLAAKLMESVGLHDQSVQSLSRMYEQLGGGGVPEGLHAKDIPIGARILAAVDSYADLTRNPSNAHGKLLSPEQAIDLLRKFAGTVFDKNIIEVLEKSTTGEKILTDLLADRHQALLIDPDPEETMVLQLRLAEQGFDVHVARGLEEARAALKGREFSLVVSEVDLDTPGAGLQLRSEVGKTKGGPKSWVFLSSRDSREVARRAFELGVDDFLTKPVATEIVVAKLTQLVERQAAPVAPKGVSGSLSEMSLTDIVQVLFHGRKTCALRLTHGDTSGEVHFDQGQIVHAIWGDATAETAFYRMLLIGEDGDFVVDAEFVPTDAPTIQASPEGLLLEGMRLLDEGAIP